jgi:hypothetical protein
MDIKRDWGVEVMNWKKFLEQWDGEGGYQSDGTFSNIVKSAVLSYWGCVEETPVVNSQQAISEETDCVENSPENGDSASEEDREDDDEALEGDKASGNDEEDQESLDNEEDEVSLNDSEESDNEALEEGEASGSDEEDQESLDNEEDEVSLNDSEESEALEEGEASGNDEEDQESLDNKEDEESPNDPEKSDNKPASGSSTQLPLPQSRPPQRNNRLPTMSKEIISAEKEKLWALATFYSKRNKVVHTDVEELEGRDLYKHLRQLEELIDEEVIQFNQKDIPDILFEIIESLIDEFFVKNERTGEIVVRGSNPRVAVDVIPVTGQKGEQEDGLDEVVEAGTSQDITAVGLLEMQGEQGLREEGGIFDVMPHTGNETGDSGVNKSNGEGISTQNDMGVSGGDGVRLGVAVGKETEVSGGGHILRRLAHPQWSGKRIVF